MNAKECIFVAGIGHRDAVDPEGIQRLDAAIDDPEIKIRALRVGQEVEQEMVMIADQEVAVTVALIVEQKLQCSG